MVKYDTFIFKHKIIKIILCFLASWNPCLFIHDNFFSMIADTLYPSVFATRYLCCVLCCTPFLLHATFTLVRHFRHFCTLLYTVFVTYPHVHTCHIISVICYMLSLLFTALLMRYYYPCDQYLVSVFLKGIVLGLLVEAEAEASDDTR